MRTMKKRRYVMKKRAESEEQTRLRITESAMALHGSLGPSRTSMTSIAEHAGVRRSTVYRHFPDEAAIFDACTNHWFALHPLPELGRWAEIEDVDQRLRTALQELYAWYGRTEQMMCNVLRDEEIVPAVKQKIMAYRFFLDAARENLLKGRRLTRARHRRTHAAIGHALAFWTWRSLAVEQQLDEPSCVDLMFRFIAHAES